MGELLLTTPALPNPLSLLPPSPPQKNLRSTSALRGENDFVPLDCSLKVPTHHLHNYGIHQCGALLLQKDRVMGCNPKGTWILVTIVSRHY